MLLMRQWQLCGTKPPVLDTEKIARCAPKAQGERLPVLAGWRFGDRALRSYRAMTWQG